MQKGRKPSRADRFKAGRSGTIGSKANRNKHNYVTQVSNPPTDIWLVMEKGAAKRFAGLPRETEKSLLLKVNWTMEIVYHFRREDFHPMPSVDSVLLHFSRKTVQRCIFSGYVCFDGIKILGFVEYARDCTILYFGI